MDPNDEIEHLLAEIRDLNRAQLEEYRRVTARFLEMQETAAAHQATAIANQRRGLRIVAGLMIALGLYLVIATVLR